jgi:hypothetical protein
MRIGTGGDAGQSPSQAARASEWKGGVQRGEAGRKAALSRPASAKSAAQSGATGWPAGSGSTCGGTT